MNKFNTADMPVSVFVVEDDDEIREGISSLIESSEGFTCDKAVSSCESAVDCFDDFLSDVVLMDIRMNGMSGIECVKRIKEGYPNQVVLMFTVHEDEEKIFESIKSGANGYILKNVAPEKILEAIKDAYQGGSPITPSIAKKILQEFSEKSDKDKDYDLTPSEKEILKHLVDGSSYITIAEDLGKSVHTIRSHIRNIYSKLYVHSKTEAVVKAIKNNLI